MEKGTSLPSSTAEHLEPEVLAAFLDGELSEDENREVRRHLAECEECHQVFVDAATFLREEETTEGTVSPFAEPTPSAKPPAIARHRPWRQNVAMAATVVLAVGTGAFGYVHGFANPDFSLAGLLAPNESATVRGAGVPRLSARQRALLVGAKSVDLRVQLDAGKDEVASSTFTAISELMGNANPKAKDREAAERLLRSGIRENLLVPQWFDLGRWARAGDLAANGKQSEFFSGWAGFKYRRVLSRLLHQADGSLTSAVLDELGKIDRLLDAPKLDFDELDAAYKAILRAS